MVAAGLIACALTGAACGDREPARVQTHAVAFSPPNFDDRAPSATTTTTQPPEPVVTTVPRRARVAAPAGPSSPPVTTAPPVHEDGQSALVSYYAYGSRTANGERFDPDGLTFAHKTMKFGTMVRFCHDGRCVTARCTDRGPFVAGRSFDLSRGAFAAIGSLSSGVMRVTWSVV